MWRITVKGMVQGIGYRPYVARLAEQLNISGNVINAAGVVVINAIAEEPVLKQFTEALSIQRPHGAVIDSIHVEKLESGYANGFVIGDSEHLQAGVPLIPRDLATCPDCEKELMDKSNRRFNYPFISCVACGPRYSIIKELPYDRCNTTMERFFMCEECSEEYTGKSDIRRHAQTIACHNCGPELIYVTADNKQSISGIDAAFSQAVKVIKSGGIVAVKNIGGFHLVCKAGSADSIASLRQIKGREKKPFAVMIEDVAAVRQYCEVGDEEAELLISNARPIVLLRKKTDDGESPYMGAMLPCNPLQIMLVKECGALIMTSANRSGEPIITDNREMLKWMQSISDVKVQAGTLMHDRDILSPLDDSIVRCVRGGRVQIIRRSRGYVPEPVELPDSAESTVTNNQVFAAGGDLKSSFCHLVGDRAYLSQYFGDLEEEKVLNVYEEQLYRMRKLFGFEPVKYAADKHPAYISSTRTHIDYKVQHHHAHIASVIAEHGLSGTTLGIAFDGTGYGDDATVWGSEFLLCSGAGYSRAAHLMPVKLIGGNEGAKNGDTILYGYLWSLKQQEIIKESEWYSAEKAGIIAAALSNGINHIVSTSMGRLFDAVSAILNICHYNDYESEAAIELEYEALKSDNPYPLKINVKKIYGETIELAGDISDLFKDIMCALKNGVNKSDIALGFHIAVCQFVLDTVRNIEALGAQFSQIALSGGTFQNSIILDKTIELLENNGYNVYINEKVPAGDSGLCLGQAYICGLAMYDEQS